jgi:hypothetical protein
MDLKKFNKAYKEIKKKGFENYFCLPYTTWKEAKEMFDAGFVLDEKSSKQLNRNINILLAPLVIESDEQGKVVGMHKEILEEKQEDSNDNSSN